MRSIMELAVAPIYWREWRGNLRRWSPGGADVAPSPGLLYLNDSTPTLTLLGLRRFVDLMVEEAVSVFDYVQAQESTICGNENAVPRAVKVICKKTDPTMLRAHLPWALWVLQTFLDLESIYLNIPSLSRELFPGELSVGSLHPSLWQFSSGFDDSDVDDNAKDFRSAIASARSPKVFALMLRFAIDSSFDEAVRISAYAVCSHALELSRVAMPALNSTESALEGSTGAQCDEQDMFQSTVIKQERALARAFSARLRSEVNSGNHPSPLLRSQLELLVQWQVGRSTPEREGRESSYFRHLVHTLRGSYREIYPGPTASSNDPWNPYRKGRKSWDVATTILAGIEGDLDTYDIAQMKEPRGFGPRRPSTTESDASALLNAGLSSRTGNHTSDYTSTLVVEFATSTSITLSWGGWLDAKQAPELQVGVDGDGVAYPLAFGAAIGASGLAQALRTKLRRIASRQQENYVHRLILKVKSPKSAKFPTF